MPEGDTLHKLARILGPALEGRTVETLVVRDRGAVPALRGRRVTEVSALGKHLLLAFGAAPRAGARAAAADWVLHVHLGMHGRVRAHRRGAPWARPAHEAAAWLEVGGAQVVFFRAAVAELLPAATLAAHPVLVRLGPDLLGARVDPARVLARARRREPGAVAELLLDQGVACGIGNVYKSEVLFVEGVHPATPVAELDDATLRRLYATARRLLRGNLGGHRRTTVRPVTADRPPRPGEPRLFVYGRAGRPCLRCGAPVAVARQGDAARVTCWCPRCQPRAARGAPRRLARPGADRTEAPGTDTRA